MEIRHLYAFTALAEDLHFGHAAERLGIAQPALSIQIQALEASLGVKLFDRSRRHVRLTESGRQFLPEASAVLAQSERARRVAIRAARGELGRLEIGFTGSTPFSRIMPRTVSRFRQDRPHIRMSLREMPTAQQMAALSEGSLDIGFVRPNYPAEHKGLILHPVLTEPLLVVLAADHPLAHRGRLSVTDLAGQSFILNPRQAGPGLHDKVADLCRQAGFDPAVVLEAHQMSTIVGLAAAGIGVSIVPEGMRHIAIDGVRFLPLSETEAVMPLMIAHRDGDDRPAVARFVALANAIADTTSPASP